MATFMPAQDAPLTKLATCYVTIKGKRYSMLQAKNFEAKVNVTTKEVPSLGRMFSGRKATGGEISFTMTIYHTTEIFDDVVEEFKNTGLMPTFDIQVTEEDPATTVGRSTKIYTNCILDGDVLLSMYDSEGDFIEQEISGYAEDFSRPEKRTNPTYM